MAALGQTASYEEDGELAIAENGKVLGTSLSHDNVALSNGITVLEPENNANLDRIAMVIMQELVMEYADADLSDAGYGSLQTAIHVAGVGGQIIKLTGGDFEKSVSEAWIVVEAPVTGMYESPLSGNGTPAAGGQGTSGGTAMEESGDIGKIPLPSAQIQTGSKTPTLSTQAS